VDGPHEKGVRDMTHFKVAVVLPERFDNLSQKKDVLEEVTRLMAPFDENDEAFSEGSRWDWWVVGGRWDGSIRGLDWLDLKELCRICNGTGERPRGLEEFGQAWYDGCNGCNGCDGTGESSVWPSDDRYTSLGRNRCRLSEVHSDYTMTAFVNPDGEWIERARMGWFGSSIPDEDGKTEEDKAEGYEKAWNDLRVARPDAIVVSLDCHV